MFFSVRYNLQYELCRKSTKIIHVFQKEQKQIKSIRTGIKCPEYSIFWANKSDDNRIQISASRCKESKEKC